LALIQEYENNAVEVRRLPGKAIRRARENARPKPVGEKATTG
jgi:hypothetical protein